MPKLADTVTGARVLGTRFLQSQRSANPRAGCRSWITSVSCGTGSSRCCWRWPGRGHRLVLYRRLEPHLAPSYGSRSAVRRVRGRRPPGLAHQLIINGLFDGFMLRVKICVLCRAHPHLPVWLYQLWAFIAPGLYRREKRWTYLRGPPAAVPGRRRPGVRGDEPGHALPARLGPDRGHAADHRRYLSRLRRSPCCSASGSPSSSRWRW